MSFAEILDEIPKLSFTERQQLIRRAMDVEDGELTAEESAILDARMKDFRADPEAGIPLEQLRAAVKTRMARG